jgi:hypothetical protein
MKFPISRTSLQQFDYERERKELQEEENQKNLTDTICRLCKNFDAEFHNRRNYPPKEKKFIWSLSKNFTGLDTFIYLPQFIDKVKELFVDCDIIIDPLKTYIIIDWS